MIEEKLNWSDRIMKTYPNATKKLTDFCYDILKGMQKTMLEGMGSDAQIPEIPQEAAKQYCHVIMATNPRILYDFFDEVGISLEIGVDRTAEPKFCYSLDGNNSDLFYKRHQAEELGFEECFKTLEAKI